MHFKKLFDFSKDGEDSASREPSEATDQVRDQLDDRTSVEVTVPPSRRDRETDERATTNESRSHPDRRTITESELQDVLEAHELWVRSGGKRGERADLSGVDLEGADLSDAQLSQADLFEARLDEAQMQGADLRRANLQESRLRGVDLHGANLEGARMYGADLTKARMRNVQLREADLTRSRLEAARLSNANLEEGNLQDANLEGAHLASATLADANLSRARLAHDAQGLPRHQGKADPVHRLDHAGAGEKVGLQVLNV
jgi:uncharacterized protein YjbI with pentapeptide repeats